MYGEFQGIKSRHPQSREESEEGPASEIAADPTPFLPVTLRGAALTEAVPTPCHPCVSQQHQLGPGEKVDQRQTVSEVIPLIIRKQKTEWNRGVSLSADC